MKKSELINLGIPKGTPIKTAFELIRRMAAANYSGTRIREQIRAVAQHPESYIDDHQFSELASMLYREVPVQEQKPAGFRCWGTDLDPESIRQMENACRLPISVAGALMPDAHVGYGLPIGGVLATRAAVIPYAVGVDIACRMKLTVLDLPLNYLDRWKSRLVRAIDAETRFGIGSSFECRRQHDVMDRSWNVSPVTRKNKDKAWSQLGTSGSGNHFVEFGRFFVDSDNLGMAPGVYTALLSHSGSRGTGAAVADYYRRVARKQHPELPNELANLAWLDINSNAGREYWQAMELMGHYAAANHACIHRQLSAQLGAEVLLDIENHHNFAWREHHFGTEVIVHRKGATPAADGVVGIIPGSMASPAFIVKGRGHPDSMNSAAHGAGRNMSRTRAKKTFTWAAANQLLQMRKVTLISAGLDEVPMAYKDIHQVIAAQKDLVEIVARFEPSLVKMAPAGERPED